jgi:phage shock protein A
VFCLQALIRDEFEKTKVTLAESSRRKLEAAVASARAESDDAAKAAAHGLRREADGARREASRAAVAARQLERSLEKTKERMEEEHAKAVGVLEAKIGSLDRTVKELRRERNALLADARAHRARQRLEQRTNGTSGSASLGQSPSVSMPNSARSRYRVRANSQEEPE